MSITGLQDNYLPYGKDGKNASGGYCHETKNIVPIKVDEKGYLNVTEKIFVADETNIMSEYLKNGGSEAQNVNGLVTPVIFSSTPVPVGKIFLASRIIIYMEGPTNFDSNKFGNLIALINGWGLAINGIEVMTAKNNRELISQMFDAHGEEIFGKVNRTMIANFAFDKFTDGADGITIREGETLDTIVKDDLTGLTYLEVRIQGVYKNTI